MHEACRCMRATHPLITPRYLCCPHCVGCQNNSTEILTDSSAGVQRLSMQTAFVVSVPMSQKDKLMEY